MESYEEYKESCLRNRLTPKTWWEWKKFQWFGDGNSIVVALYALVILRIAFWIFIIYVIAHFLAKYW